MKKNDIVICVTDKMYGQKQTLKIGEQYRVDDFIEMAEKNLVSVYYETMSVFLMINILYR